MQGRIQMVYKCDVFLTVHACVSRKALLQKREPQRHLVTCQMGLYINIWKMEIRDKFINRLKDSQGSKS